jgi:hypothetical protein
MQSFPFYDFFIEDINGLAAFVQLQQPGKNDPQNNMMCPAVFLSRKLRMEGIPDLIFSKGFQKLIGEKSLFFHCSFV